MPKRVADKKSDQAKLKSLKKSRQAEEEKWEQPAVFLDDDDKPQGSDDDEEEPAKESVEEKRLRLAREYLERVQADVGSSGRRERFVGVTGGREEEEGSGSDEEGGDHDAVSARLQTDALEASGRAQRKLAHTVRIPDYDAEAEAGGCGEGHGSDGDGPSTAAGGSSESDPSSASAAAAARVALHRGHRLPATAVALAADDSFCVTVSKDGSILKWDLTSATMAKTRLYRPGEEAVAAASHKSKRVKGGGKGGKGQAKEEIATTGTNPDWVKRNPRAASKLGLYAVALSYDSKYLAVGGGDKKVHVFDALSGKFLQSFPGHRDVISALAFRDASHQLFSASYDRTVKMWSLDDRAYMDTLFGHQAEVLSLDVLRAERALTGGSDRSLRVWKVPEESQLVFRAPAMSSDCVKMLSLGEFVSAGSDGTLQVWNQLRKKPLSIVAKAHGSGARAAHGGACAGCVSEAWGNEAAPGGSGTRLPVVASWVQSLAVCRNSDLVASGAADGTVRVWRVVANKMGSAQELECMGGLPVRGCVNGLAISRTGALLVAAVGQEPRLGRWLRDGRARNGLAVFRLPAAEA
ncbi:hypothetical protein FOA52_001760 [Chlamydomonas sp. UWO 241]|nr:hypothetical protein FOA52_001760 [Chlamydomonas sp. UWO 241]